MSRSSKLTDEQLARFLSAGYDRAYDDHIIQRAIGRCDSSTDLDTYLELLRDTYLAYLKGETSSEDRVADRPARDQSSLADFPLPRSGSNYQRVRRDADYQRPPAVTRTPTASTGPFLSGLGQTRAAPTLAGRSTEQSHASTRFISPPAVRPRVTVTPATDHSQPGSSGSKVYPLNHPTRSGFLGGPGQAATVSAGTTATRAYSPAFTKPSHSPAVRHGVAVPFTGKQNTPTAAAAGPKIYSLPAKTASASRDIIPASASSFRRAPDAARSLPSPSAPSSSRMIVLDASNIACYHGSAVSGQENCFSAEGIRIAIDYFREKYGATSQNLKALVPVYRMGDDPKGILQQLKKSGYLSFTPAKTMPDGKRVRPYDDRFILDLAVESDGVVISNDKYADLIHEPRYTDLINNRVIMYTFAGDYFLPAQDPQGRNGRSLDELLRVPGRYAPASHGSY